MKDMMSVYQEINKRRQLEEMDVNSLTMFAEAWGYQKRIIDEQQKKIDKIVSLVWSETPDYDLDNKIKEILK